jgi:predicted mannosyl-3-phosphoglycerate phosphatase (HAD superfamily)
VPEDLSVGELGRTVNALRQEIQAMGQGINSRLDKVVSTEVYALQSAYTDQRINQLGQELQKVRDERDALENAFEAEKLAERDRRERERQARLYQMIVPVLMGLLSAAIAIWAVVAK